MSGQCNLIHRMGGGGQPADSELGWGGRSGSMGLHLLPGQFKGKLLLLPFSLSFSDGVNLLEWYFKIMIMFSVS